MPQKQMKRGALSLEVALAADQQPPAEFRIFPAGSFDTLKGSFVFDDKAAAAVMKAAQDYGNDYCLDYCHAAMGAKEAPDPANAGKAAGWFKPELRDGELWAANVRWTPAAAQMLKDREYRYISPTFDFLDDGTVAELINVALTNVPATKKLTPLMASLSRDRRTRAALGQTSFNEVTNALGEALREKFPRDDNDTLSSGPWVVDVYDDRVVFDLNGRTYQVAYRLDGTKAVLTSDPIEVQRTYTPVPGGQPMEEMMKQLAALAGLPETAKPEEIHAALKTKLANAIVPPAGTTAPMKCAKCSAASPAGAKFCAQCAEPLPIVAIDDDDDETMPEPVKAALAQQRKELDRIKREGDEAKAELARIRDAQELARFETEAAGYKALAQEPKKFAPTLMALSRKAPEEKKVLDELLKKANAALSQSEALKVKGRAGSAEVGDAKVELERLVGETLKENAQLTRSQAVSRILRQRPDLYAAAQE